jgi:hypothetical protein
MPQAISPSPRRSSAVKSYEILRRKHMRLITLSRSAFSLYLNGLAICKKKCSFLMIFTLLYVFSVIPAHAEYVFTSINASTDSPTKSLNALFTYTSTDSSKANINIQGAPTPLSGTYTYTFTWSPASTTPPATVYFKETGQAVGTGLGLSTDDGLKDAGTNPYSGNEFCISQGTHYVGMHGTSTITITVTPSVKESSIWTGTAGLTLSVIPITKGGYISTSLGATCHKGNVNLDNYGYPDLDSNGLPTYSKDPDTYDASGAFQANTVMPADGTGIGITYYANSVGAWASNSAALLNVASNSESETTNFTGACAPIKGTWAPLINFSAYGEYDNNEPVYSSTYDVLSFKNTTVPVEYVKMTLTDANDGSICVENYDLTFHQPFENWQKNGSEFQIAPAAGAASPVVIAGDSADVPEPLATENFSAGQQIISGILTAGACLIVPETTAVAPEIQSLMAAAAVTLSFEASVAPSGTSKQSGDYRQLENDVEDEMSIEADVPVTDCAAAYGLTHRFADDKIANWLNSTCFDDQDYRIAHCGNELDSTGKNYMSFRYSITRYFIVDQQNWVGDGYGTQGYSGSTSGSTIILASKQNLFLWSEIAGAAAPSNHGSSSSSSSSTPSVTSD